MPLCFTGSGAIHDNEKKTLTDDTVSMRDNVLLRLTSLKAQLGTLSKDVFERRTSTGSEALSLFICLDANKLVLLSFFSLLKTIYPRVSTKPLPNDAKSPLPVDVRPSKTLLLKLPIVKCVTATGLVKAWSSNS